MIRATHHSEPATGRHRKRLAAVCTLAVVVVGVVAVLLLRDRETLPEAPDDAVHVPLGVEEAVIIRFAGPQLVPRPYRRGASVTFAPPKTERQLSNIQIVLDCSLSMREAYGRQSGGEAYTRFDGAMDSIEKFVTAREGDAFGLTVFSKNFLHWVPLTQDVDAIRRSRPFIAPENFPDPIWGGTYVAKALDGSIAPLAKHADGDRMIILITDGESRDLEGETLRQIIAKLRRANIVVFAISMTDNPIAQGLKDVTQQTSGAVFKAVTPETLQIVFRSIDQMQKVEVRSVRAQVIDFYEPFILPALIVLGLQLLALFGIRFTPW